MHVGLALLLLLLLLAVEMASTSLKSSPSRGSVSKPKLRRHRTLRGSWLNCLCLAANVEDGGCSICEDGSIA